jgi:glycyl-tRNA synthetase alpha chain
MSTICVSSLTTVYYCGFTRPRRVGSPKAVGIDLSKNDIQFEEDNREAPTLGAWGIGWPVTLDGLEITQSTYFQQCGGFDLDLIHAELTYGLERTSAFLQNVESVYDIECSLGVRYSEVRLEDERQFSKYNFELADVVLPTYDQVLKCSHIFNLLDARGATSVIERVGVIAPVRKPALGIPQAWMTQNEPKTEEVA